MDLNAAAADAETALLQRMLKFVTFGGEQPTAVQIKALKDMRAAGLDQLDRALAELKAPPPA